MLPLDAPPAKLLEDILLSFRLGLYDDSGDLQKWRLQIEERLTVLHHQLAANPDCLDAVLHAKLISVQTDFWDTLGNTRLAQQSIENFVSLSGGDLELRITGFRNPPPKPRPASSGDDEQYARWIRQVAWLHINAAWVLYFRVGRYDEARTHLHAVIDYVKQRLVTELARPSYGTLSRCYYCLGHCERSLRKFDSARNAFIFAESLATERYRHKKNKVAQTITDPRALMTRLAPERRLLVIATARILGGGLAWVNLHQGRLSESSALAKCAETLLEDTGQEPGRLFVSLNRTTAIRRSAKEKTADANRAMRDLIKIFYTYRKADHILGQLRAGIEYLRGHLDYLEFVDPATQAQADIERSHKKFTRWLTLLRPLVAEEPNKVWELRLNLIEWRYRTLREEPQTLQQLLTGNFPPDGPDPDSPLLMEQEIVFALLSARCGAFDAAMKALRRAIALARGKDPTIEAQCHLQMASLALMRDDLAHMDDCLKEWAKFERITEHAFLKSYAASLRRQLENERKPFVLRFEDPLEWDAVERKLRLWLAKAARHRAGANAQGKDIAKVLDINPSSWSRWPKE